MTRRRRASLLPQFDRTPASGLFASSAIVELYHRRIANMIPTAPGRQRFSDDDLLDAALVVFSDQGYQGAQMEQLGAAAGTTKQTLYARLGSKENIYLRVLQREATSLSERLRSTYESSRDLPLHEVVEATVGAFFDFGVARRHGMALLLGTTRGGPATDLGHNLIVEIIGFLTDLIRHRYSTHAAGSTAPEAAIVAAMCVGAARQVCEQVLQDDLDIDVARRQVSTFVESGLRSLVGSVTP